VSSPFAVGATNLVKEMVMFVIAKLDTYGYGDGERLQDVYGPFPTHEEAEAFNKRVSKLNLVGVEYRVKEVCPLQQEIDFLNGLGMGEV
jgi:hypothetical protein